MGDAREATHAPGTKRERARERDGGDDRIRLQRAHAKGELQDHADVRGTQGRVVCKVEDFSGETIKATTSDKQTIFIKPKQGSQYDTAYVEIEGVVENNTTIQEDGFTTFGDDFE